MLQSLNCVLQVLSRLVVVTRCHVSRGVNGARREGPFMCLAVSGKVVHAEECAGLRVGRVQFGGIVRSVRLYFVPEAEVGDYVMVHVGFAISRVDEKEAERLTVRRLRFKKHPTTTA